MSRSTGFQRSLDWYLGDAIALLLALRRPAAAGIADPSRIGFIQPSAIGDVILASGLIAHARAAYPRAEIHLLHGPSNGAVVELLEPGIVGHTLDFTKPRATVKHIRSLRLDVLVDLVPWSSITGLVCRFSGVPVTLGFAVPGRFRHFLFARVVEYSSRVHQSKNFEALGRVFGPPATPYAYRLRRSFPRPAIQLPYDRLIVCHMQPGGSRAHAKAWPTEHWVALVDRLCKAGYAVAFSGSPADRIAVESVIARIEDSGRQCFSLAGNLTLPEFCFVLQRAQLAISVDTSALHIASALGVPVVGIHGPSLSRQWGAISSNSWSIDAAHPAAGHIQFGFESHPNAHEIMGSISVDEVYGAASTLLANSKVRSCAVG